jgi:prepilin-type N-terminal cleavage/methylation domain-containing protein
MWDKKMRIIERNSGLTLVELSFALIILAVICAIGIYVYIGYIDKAKITVAEDTLLLARDNLNIYNMDKGKYPDSISFDTCVDENSRAVFSSSFCKQLKEDLSSIDSYTYNTEQSTYTLIARAKNVKRTPLTLTPTKVTK